MKKALLFFVILLLAWCSNSDKLNENKNFDNEKKCADMRNDFVNYLNARYNFIEEPEVIAIGNWQEDWYTTNKLYESMDWINYNILKKIKVFYSEWLDSCIWIYLLHNYYPTAWGHMDVYNWYAEDILKDEIIDERFDIDYDEFDSMENLRRNATSKLNN